MMLDGIVVLRLARSDEARRRRKIARVDQAHLRGLMVVHAEQQEAAALGGAEAEEISRGRAARAGRVSALVAAEVMAEHPAGPMLLVEPDIEERPAVGRPFEAAVIVGDLGIDDGAGLRLDDVHREELRALGVDRVGDQCVVGAVRDVGDAEIGVVAGKRVAVDQELLGAAVSRRAAEQRMLTAGDEARVVGEGAVGRGDRGVVLLDAALHLGEEQLLQRLGLGHDGLGVGVLGFEMSADLGIEHGGIAHHRLPIVGAQPCIVVHPHDAVMRGGERPAGGAGRGYPRAREFGVHAG